MTPGLSRRRGSNSVFDRDHRLVQVGTEQLRQEPAARTSDAVLARDRAVILRDQAPDVRGQRLHAQHAADCLEIEHGPDVQASGGRVAGEAGPRAVSGDDPLEVVDEAGQPLGRHGRVLHERRRALRARRAHEERQDGTAQGRRLGEVGGLLEPDLLRGAELGGEHAQPREAGKRLVIAPLVLDGEHGRVVAGEQARHAPERGDVGRPAQRREVEELDRGRRGLQDGEVRLERGAQGGERERRAHPPRRARVEQHLQLGEERERALRAGEQPAEIGLRGQQFPQVVAGRAAPRLREPGGDGLAVPLAHLRERRREPLPRRAVHACGEVACRAGAERHGLAAGEHPRDAEHLVLALAVDDRARAGGVVADHPGDRRLVDRGRVGAELQAVRRRGRVERRLHHPRLDPGPASLRVDLEDAVELEAVDDDAGPDRLPGEAGGGAARDDREPGLRGGRRRGRKVVRRRRHDDHFGHDPVAGGVGGVEPAAEGRRRDLAGHRAAQRVRGGATLRRELRDAVTGGHAA